MVISFLLFIILLLFSAFFSASETAIFSLKPTQIENFKSQDWRTRILKKMLRQPSRLLAVIVLSNMLVNIAFASLSTVIFVKFFSDNAVFAAIIFSTLLILFFGEIFPKSFSFHQAKQISLLATPLLNFFLNLFYPLVMLFQKISDSISRFVLKKIKIKGLLDSYTEEELKTAIDEGKKEGLITEDEEEMITYLLQFKETSAWQIMTPRVDVQALAWESSKEQVEDFLVKTRHSKIPVYRENMDNIVGILYTKEFFLKQSIEKNFDWHSILHEPFFIPESQKIDDVLINFVKNNERIAVVLDEYGGTAGIVTFEDVAEEIFGEIYDEFEKPDNFIVSLADKKYIVSAKAPIKTVNVELETDFPEEKGTMAAFVLSLFERFPKEGEQIEYKQIKITVIRASRRRLITIMLELP